MVQPKIGNSAATLNVPCSATGQSKVGIEDVFSVEFVARAASTYPELPRQFWSFLTTVGSQLQTRTLMLALQHFSVTLEALTANLHRLDKEYGNGWIFDHPEALRVLWGAIHPQVTRWYR